MNVPVPQDAEEKRADGRNGELGEPDQDEHGVAAAEVEPVAAQEAKADAGMGLLIDQNARDTIFFDLILVATATDLPLAVQSPSSEST